jgi:hypothetical protein
MPDYARAIVRMLENRKLNSRYVKDNCTFENQVKGYKNLDEDSGLIGMNINNTVLYVNIDLHIQVIDLLEQREKLRIATKEVEFLQKMYSKKEVVSALEKGVKTSKIISIPNKITMYTKSTIQELTDAMEEIALHDKSFTTFNKSK